MGHVGDAARHPGDIAYRLTRVEDAIRDLQTARGLEAASIGAGGLRVQGGRVLAEDSAGTDVFEVTTEPPAIFMRPELIDSLTREIIGASVNHDNVEDQESAATNGSWADLATVGPQVSVDISEVGRALVQFGAVMTANPGSEHVSMSFEVSGASSQAPTGFRSVQLQATDPAPVVLSTSMAVLVDGLNEGQHTFTAKYMAATTGTGFWGNRWLIVYPY